MMHKTQIKYRESKKVEMMHQTYIKYRESESGNDALNTYQMQRKWKWK